MEQPGTCRRDASGQLTSDAGLLTAVRFDRQVRFTERLFLHGLVAEPQTAREQALRSRLFLKADADGPSWTDSQIAEAFEIGTLKVARLRKGRVLEGLELAALEQKRGKTRLLKQGMMQKLLTAMTRHV